MSSETLAAGQTLGRYRIVRPLGSGAMGDVYLAEDPQIERPIAIKTVRLAGGKPAEVEDRKRRLLREAKAAGKLIHPNVITLFDAGEQDGVLFLAFEFVDGSDLATRLESLPPLTIGQALRIIRETAEALDFAHQHGVVHRDIKPGNILLDRHGRAKVADFGIARVAGQATELTMTGSVVGSPHYLSPEQVRGEELDGRTDVFSLGVVFWETLGHRRPFDGETITTLVYQILNKDPGPVPKLRAGLSPAVDDVVRRMLAKDRDQRYRTAGEVAEEMRRLERELPRELLAAPASADQDADADATLMFASGPHAKPTRDQTGRPQSNADLPTTILGTPATQALPGVVPPVPGGTPQATPSRGTTGKTLAILGAVVLVVAGVAGWGGWTLWRAASERLGLADGAGTTDARQGNDQAGQEPAEAPAGGSQQSAGTSDRDGQQAAGTSAPSPSPGLSEGAVSDGGQQSAGTSQQSGGTSPGGRQQSAGTSPQGTSPQVTPRQAPGTVPSNAVPAPVVDEPEPRRPAVALPSVDREMTTGLALNFQVEPGDAFLRLRDVSESRATPIGQAQDYTGKGREGRSYRLPGPGQYVLSLRKEGLDDYDILLNAEEGRGTSNVVVDLRTRRGAPGATTSVAAGLMAVREGVILKGGPDGATVSVDGVAMGPARDFGGGIGGRKFLRLEPGLRRIALAAPGYARQEFEVQVSPGAPRDRDTLRFELRRE